MLNTFNGIIACTLSVIFVLTVCIFPGSVNAGNGNIISHITDSENSRLVGYWDLRERETLFQVTNTSGSEIRVHIQIFDVSTGCAEFDYFDTFTPRDTHIYDVRSLDRNNSVELSAPDLTDGHGIVAVTHVDGSDIFDPGQVLTGNFRIIDNAGYEYRTNLPGTTGGQNSPPSTLDSRVNFNNVDGSSFADLVIIGVANIDNPGGIAPLTIDYDFTLYDQDENPISCPPLIIGCFEEIGAGGIINVGINQSVTNSRGGPSVCLGSDDTGFLEISSDLDRADGYYIFMGLNNGNDTGSMDSGIINIQVSDPG